VLLGEFGAYDKSGTPIADRVRYTETVRRAAESHGFPWAYWQFEGDFVLYDIDHDQWVEPIRAALVGKQ
jgi:endoglucanase